MGFDLHITRANNWKQNEGAEIDKSEWLSLVDSDEELALDPQNGDCSVTWAGSSDLDSPWFDWSEGNVYTSDPDSSVLGKMLQMAEALGARVQGDDGKVYSNITEWNPT